MTDYALEYTDGQVSDIVADTDQEAIAAALARFEPEAVAAEAWDNAGSDEDNRQRERLLIWADDNDMVRDGDGSQAVAQITVVRSHQAD